MSSGALGKTPGMFVPGFTGLGKETVLEFVARIDEEILLRGIQTDKEKLAIFTSRLSCDPECPAALIAGCRSMKEKKNYYEYVEVFTACLNGNRKQDLMATLVKHTSEAAQSIGVSHNIFRSENKATVVADEILHELKHCGWLEDDIMTEKDLGSLLTMMFTLLNVDNDIRDRLRNVRFDTTSDMLDICQQVGNLFIHQPGNKSFSDESRSSTPVTETGSCKDEQTKHQSRGAKSSDSPFVGQQDRDTSCRDVDNYDDVKNGCHRQGRSQSRRHNSHSMSDHSLSTSYKDDNKQRRSSRPPLDTLCTRCGLSGHMAEICRVRLDDEGRALFNPNLYCRYHKRSGHDTQSCDTFKSGKGGRYHSRRRK